MGCTWDGPSPPRQEPSTFCPAIHPSIHRGIYAKDPATPAGRSPNPDNAQTSVSETCPQHVRTVRERVGRPCPARSGLSGLAFTMLQKRRKERKSRQYPLSLSRTDRHPNGQEGKWLRSVKAEGTWTPWRLLVLHRGLGNGRVSCKKKKFWPKGLSAHIRLRELPRLQPI